MVMPMDVFEAVESRIACRWFLDTPVDAEIVRDLIARAARAASGGNLQSWQVYALAGAPLAALKRKVAAHIAGHDPRHDDAEYPIYPKTMWEPYKSRREEHGVQLYGALEIARDDAEGRLAQYKRNFEFSNGPISAAISTLWRSSPAATASIPARRNPGPACTASSANSSKCRPKRCCSAPSPSVTATTAIRPTASARRALSLRSSVRFLDLNERGLPLPACGERVG